MTKRFLTTVALLLVIRGGANATPCSTVQQVGSASAIALTVPSCVVTGTPMFAQVVYYNPITLTPPAGWALVRSDNDGNSSIQAIYSRSATSGDTPGSTYTWNCSAACFASGGIIAIPGYSTSVDAQSGNTATDGTHLTALSVTTTAANDYLLLLYGANNNAVNTAPSGFNVEWNKSNGGLPNGLVDQSFTTIAADKVIASAGATGNQVATLGASSAGPAAQAVQIAVLPAGSSTPTPAGFWW